MRTHKAWKEAGSPARADLRMHIAREAAVALARALVAAGAPAIPDTAVVCLAELVPATAADLAALTAPEVGLPREVLGYSYCARAVTAMQKVRAFWAELEFGGLDLPAIYQQIKSTRRARLAMGQRGPGCWATPGEPPAPPAYVGLPLLLVLGLWSWTMSAPS